MNKRTFVLTASLACLPLSAALADDRESASIEALKSSLRNPSGFEVDKVRVTDAGVACITYRVDNDNGGEMRAHAVVEGDKVLRSSIGNTRFEKAWKSKCVEGGVGDGG
jgi:hypothetical protein